ncbi:MAG TPA: hypothetical protein VMI56_12820 [Reyranella sp.]|nr:hypothetical protein [Reyranella sp.]
MSDEGLKDEVARRYAAWDRRRQEIFLAEVASWLTLEGRGTYVAGGTDLADAPKMRKINEAIHRILGHLTCLMAGVEDRRPDDVMVDLIVDLFRDVGANPDRLLGFPKDRTSG